MAQRSIRRMAWKKIYIKESDDDDDELGHLRIIKKNLIFYIMLTKTQYKLLFLKVILIDMNVHI